MAEKEVPAGHMPMAQAVQVLDRTESQIRALARAGVIPPLKDGAVSITAMARYIKHLHESSGKGPAAEAAAHIGVTERRFREMISRGVIKPQARSQYDFAQVRVEYINHLREAAAGRQTDSGMVLANERARHAKAMADAQEMKNKVEAEEYLPRGEIQMIQAAGDARVRTKLLAIPSKAAPRLLGLETLPDIKDALSNAINEALAELANTRVVGILPGRDKAPGLHKNAPRALGVLHAATAGDDKRMGGRKPKTKP